MRYGRKIFAFIKTLSNLIVLQNHEFKIFKLTRLRPQLGFFQKQAANAFLSMLLNNKEIHDTSELVRNNRRIRRSIIRFDVYKSDNYIIDYRDNNIAVFTINDCIGIFPAFFRRYIVFGLLYNISDSSLSL